MSKPVVIDCSGSLFTLQVLDMLLTALRAGDDVTVCNCRGNDMLTLGMYLAGMYERAKQGRPL